MKTNDRYRKSVAPLLESGETLLAAPVLGAWVSAGVARQTIGRASRGLGGSGTASALYGRRGVAGKLLTALGLDDADV